MPNAITRLFKEAYNTFPPLKGKATNNDLLVIRRTLLSPSIVILYDQLQGTDFLTAILTEATKYKANHGNNKFVHPKCLPLYNTSIANNATTVIQVRAEAAHKSCLNDFANYKGAEHCVSKFLRDVVDTIWYNDLKDADTFYTKVTPSLMPTAEGYMPST
jgi:hypothetical protein